MSDKYIEFEHRPDGGFVLRIKPPKIRSIPESARQHAKTAHKETLLALRGIIDAAIEHIEKCDNTEKTERTKIEVQ